MEKLKILFYGAGVIGSFYAARLSASHDVTLLARGKRLQNLRENGLVVVDEDTGVSERYGIGFTERLAPEDEYDYIFVTLRCNQLHPVLPEISANCSKNVVFFMNAVTGYDTWREALGKRLLSGFPMAGGEIREGVVHIATGAV